MKKAIGIIKIIILVITLFVLSSSKVLASEYKVLLYKNDSPTFENITGTMMEIGQIRNVYVYVTNENGKQEEIVYEKLGSSDDKVITVYGKSIKAVEPGTATIIVYNEKNEEMANISVEVEDPYYKVPDNYKSMYNNNEYLHMTEEKLKEHGTEIRKILKQENLKKEDEELLRKLLTRINDMINNLRNDPGDVGGWLGQAKDYVSNVEQTVSVDKIANAAVSIGQVLITVAIIIYPIIVLVMGIKYLVASADEKGKLKTQIVGLLVACVITFGAYGVWKLAYYIANFITN